MTAADPRHGLRAKCPSCDDNDPLATQVSVDSCRGFKYAVMTCRCGHGEVAAYYDDDRSLQDLSDKFYRIAHARPEAVDSNKPVAWWNGISESVFNERDGRGPSIRWGADAENTWHDIPLYAGYNPVRDQQGALLEEAALTPERAP